MGSPILAFLGATGAVTGSKLAVSGSSADVWVDAGLYQGLAELRRLNWQAPAGRAADLAAVVVTHAHLDHCGYLPRLVKDGFRGRIHCTPETADLVAIVLRDSAHLQEEDARLANDGGWSRHRPALPLYDLGDVERTLALVSPVEYDTWFDLAPGTRARLSPAGHILGSASVLLDVDGHRAVFSGDLGRGRHPLLRPAARRPDAATVVVESTYGDRIHPDPDPDLLASAVRRTIRRGGSVLIPAFAVDRTELVLVELHRLMSSGRVPRVPVYLDSPMAIEALAVYRRAFGAGSRRSRPNTPDLRTVIGDLRLVAVTDAAGSVRLNSPEAPCIIVSASGMATGGRVVHHLAHQLPDPRNTVVLTGYQAVGTRGRQLLDGARQLKMHGRYVPVRAEVVDDQSFSVHADAGELLAWLTSARSEPEVVYVVHGEPASSAALARRIGDDLGWNAVVPRLDERVRLA